MGGYYSGRWHWYTRKTTVEECHKISVSDFATETLARRFEAGLPVWYGESGPSRTAALIARSVIKAAVERAGRTYNPAPPDTWQTGQAFAITRTACTYGGWRYWLLCPDCGRRCGKLYKPRAGYRDEYLCRDCHDLVYSSAQDARKYPVSFRQFAHNVDRIVRAELVLQKLEKCRPASKNYWRLVRHYEQIMAGVKRSKVTP